LQIYTFIWIVYKYPGFFSIFTPPETADSGSFQTGHYD